MHAYTYIHIYVHIYTFAHTHTRTHINMYVCGMKQPSYQNEIERNVKLSSTSLDIMAVSFNLCVHFIVFVLDYVIAKMLMIIKYNGNCNNYDCNNNNHISNASLLHSHDAYTFT